MDKSFSGGKPIAYLDQWVLVRLRIDPVVRALLGVVYGHPRFPAGRWVHTSEVLWVDLVAQRAETLNTQYRLLRRLEGALPGYWDAAFERVGHDDEDWQIDDEGERRTLAGRLQATPLPRWCPDSRYVLHVPRMSNVA